MPPRSNNYTHVRGVKREGIEIHLIDIPCSGVNMDPFVTVINPGSDSITFDEMDAFLKDCQKN